MRARSEEDIMELTIYVKKIVRAMIIAVLLITLISFAARVAMYLWGQEGYLQPLRIFDVGEERSIPTWFESIQFLLCSILEAIGQQSERLLHNTTGFIPSGAIKFFWVVPGTIFVFIVLVAYLRFLADLPQSTRRLFLFAGAVFVLGALGLEMLSAQVSSSSEGIANFFGMELGLSRHSGSAIPKIMIGLQTCFEEMFEMLGLTAFVYALLAYIRSYIEDTHARVRLDKS